MSPAQFHDQKPPKREIDGNGTRRPPLKITKDSHFIKKSSPPHSSAAASTRPQQRHPVIIYTHSPKVIHTHPRDFMALVQKLTGLSRSDDDPPRPKREPAGGDAPEDEPSEKHRPSGAANDDTESSSVITEENCGGSVVGDVQINSCYAPPPPPPPTAAAIYDPCFDNIPLFNSSDFLPFNYNNYAESLYLVPTMRSSISSSSTFEGIKEHRDY